MKSCPMCKRTYADDTFTFCLDDGALLSAPYDPQATLQIPAPRQTDQPRAEILSAPLTHGDSLPSQSQKRGGKTNMVVGGVIVFLTAGVLLLGYLVWKGNQTSSSEGLKSDAHVQSNDAAVTPTVPVNNNVSDNVAGGRPPKPTGTPSSAWLEGVWEGKGYQHAPKMTWSVKLTAENNTYTIEYPSLRCGGKWTLMEMGDGRAQFKEEITRGQDRCSSNGDILVERISDYQVSYKYTLPVIGEVATATLSKGAVR